jgi:hypothetical protein
MNLLNTNHFYDTTINHCAHYMVDLCNNRKTIALDMAKVTALEWLDNDVIYAEVRFLCTNLEDANDNQLSMIRRAICDHGLINKVNYVSVFVSTLENKGLKGVFVSMRIKPSRLHCKPASPDHGELTAELEAAACRRLRLR